jgi:hypothetical protein
MKTLGGDHTVKASTGNATEGALEVGRLRVLLPLSKLADAQLKELVLRDGPSA